MKKIVSILLALIMSIIVTVPAFASSAAVEKIAETVISLIKDDCDNYNDFISKRTTAARWFYFYFMLNDSWHCPSDRAATKFDNSGTRFSDEYLQYYFDAIFTHIGNLSGSHFYTSAYLMSEGDIFIQACGDSSSFDLNMLGYIEPNSSDLLESSIFRTDSMMYALYKEKDNAQRFQLSIFNNFKNASNTMLARYLLKNGETATDPAPGKNGLEIAPAYVTSDELIEGIEKDNLMFFPKNYDAKISYRTDEFFQKRQANRGNEYYSPFIINNSLFVGTNNAQFTYFVPFVKQNGVLYFSDRQFKVWFDVSEVKDDSGNFLDYSKTINYKWWLSLDGDEDNPNYVYNGTDDLISKGSKYIIAFAASNVSFHAYSSFTYFLNDDYRLNIGPGFSLGTYYTPDFLNTSSAHRPFGSYDYHSTRCHYDLNGECDFGFLVSDTPIEFTWSSIDTSKIGRGQIVTINGGDTIYNYTITNPETGDSSKFGDYITNNYTYITNNNGGSSSSGGSDGTVGGKVEVGGKIDVGGSVGVDVNVNVSGGGNSSLPDIGDISNNLPEAPQGFIDYLASLFSFLPAQVWALIIGAISAAVLCRVWGR